MDNKKRKKIIYAGIALIICTLIVLGFSFVERNFSLDFTLDGLRNYVDGKSYSEIIFIAMWSLRLVAFIPGVTLMILGGLIFTPGKAFILSLIGIVLSDTLVYLVAKSKVFEGFRNKMVNKYPDLIELVETYNYKILFVGVLCPVAPTDVLVFLSSYLGMSYRKFLVVFTVANLPALLLYSYLGESFQTSVYNSIFIIITLIASGILTIKLWNELRGKLKRA